MVCREAWGSATLSFDTTLFEKKAHGSVTMSTTRSMRVKCVSRAHEHEHDGAHERQRAKRKPRLAGTSAHESARAGTSTKTARPTHHENASAQAPSRGVARAEPESERNRRNQATRRHNKRHKNYLPALRQRPTAGAQNFFRIEKKTA